MSSADQSALDVLLELTSALRPVTRVEDLYTVGLESLLRALGTERSSILLRDGDGILHVKAARGLSERYRAHADGLALWPDGTTAPQPIVVPDVSRDPSFAHQLPALREERIGSIAFVPLIGSGRIIGAFGLYSERPRSLRDRDLATARLIAAQVALAVERTEALGAVAASEERLRFALDSAHVGTWEWDLASNAIRWSENVARIHRVDPHAFDGSFESYSREIHPEDRERVLASVRQAVEDGSLHDVEYRIVTPGGEVRWLEGKGRVERDAVGTPVRMTGICLDVTPRKRAELARLGALEQSHAVSHRLAAIVAGSDDAIVSKDLHGVISSWNAAAERMFGYTAAEAIGRSIKLIIPDERQREEDMVLSRIHAGHAVEHFETVRRRKDGSLLDVSLTVSPIRDGAGTVVGASKIARDITARKQSERELADLHRRLTLLLDASATLLETPDVGSVFTATIAVAGRLLQADGHAIWRGDAAGTWRVATTEGLSDAFTGRVTARDAGAETLASEPLIVADVSTMPGHDRSGAMLREEGIRSLLACPMRFGKAESGTLVFYYRRPHTFDDAEVRTAQAVANLAGAAITTAELYEEQERQREAAESASRQAAFLAQVATVLAGSLDYEQTLRAVAELAVPEFADWCAVDIVNEPGRIQRLAVAHRESAPASATRRVPWERYPLDPHSPGGPSDVIRTGEPTMLEVVPAAFLDGAAGDVEHVRLIRERELALTSYVCVPLKSGRRTFGAMSFAFADSGRHYTAADRQFAEEVASRAALAIENAHAYRRAHEANRLKDEFLATLSHELRTPLNAILGYAQMLAAGVLEGDQQSTAITVISRNADSLRQIIDDVLDVSRITAGKLRLNVQPVDLAEIVKNALATVAPAADAKGLRLQVITDPGVSTISGDPDRLQQVVWNLLSNAVKFTPRGGRIQLRVERAASHADIVVSDTGQGIDREFLPHLFERFRQGDGRFSREHGGLGLGLSIVRELVELHGGTVTAFSGGAGAGATFRVSLPLMMVQPPVIRQDERGLTQSVPYPSPRVRLDGIRVLAVDDQEDALGVLRLILETAGARVTTVGSGARALDVLRTEAQDALIADIGMPHMDGLELIRMVRQSLPYPANRVPAAALTAYARAEDRVTALASGFQMHLAKPVNAAELVVAVAALVGRPE